MSEGLGSALSPNSSPKALGEGDKRTPLARYFGRGAGGEGDPGHAYFCNMHKRPEHIIKLAREFRKEQTYTEKLMWGTLRRHKQRGLKFRREHPIIGYIADFYCAEHRLIIEIDGNVHLDETVANHDKERQQHLEAAGFRVMRFTADEVMINIDGVIDRILKACGERPLP
jgi:very-short-patch-repair endonuclease